MNYAIKFDRVSKKYPTGAQALKNISLTVQPGEFIYIVGQSGSGKSTLIKSIFREEKITSGKLDVIGFDVRKLRNDKTHLLRQQIGVVFQDYKLIKNKTVFENVIYALNVTDLDYTTFNERVMDVLRFVGLEAKANVFSDELSGGEQQRLAIARAIVNKPKLIIADEPTGNLDPATTWEIMDILERINISGTTVIMVTHNEAIVNKLRHRTITIDKGTIISDKRDGEV
jgi:cell division transport system ATP-binding protein